MVVPRPSGWRFNLILFILVGSFAVTVYLMWERRASWHVVATLRGLMPSLCDCFTPVPSVVNAQDGIITFADTRETYAMPPEYRGKFRNVTFCSARAAFRFTGGPDSASGQAVSNRAHR